jgi:DNA-binding NtrC family response regulator
MCVAVVATTPSRRFLLFALRMPSLLTTLADGPSDEAAARDILIVDGNAEVLRRLEQLFVEGGFHVTAVSDVDRARDQLTNRFFPIVVLDLDTPRALGGIDLLQFAKQSSPVSALIVLSPRRSFEAVASAFRAGATDVIPKTEEALPYLRSRVTAAARDFKAAQDRERLLVEASEMHDQFLQEMMALSRHIIDLEDKILRGDGEGSTTSIPRSLELLVVDDQATLSKHLAAALPPEKGWHVRYVQTSGEALDAATQTTPQVLVTQETLPDLPSSMLIKTVKATSPDLVALVFRPPDAHSAGEVMMVESSKVVTLIPAYSDPDQLVEALQEVREALRRKAKERRYVAVFRKQHSDFLKRYATLKNKMTRKD